jgi:hypothetical protein
MDCIYAPLPLEAGARAVDDDVKITESEQTSSGSQTKQRRRLKKLYVDTMDAVLKF